MIRYENDCVDCGLPCMGNACRLARIPHFYCDRCGEEEQLYEYDGNQLCLCCIEEKLEKVGVS